MQRKNRYTTEDYVRFFQKGDEKGFTFFFREYYAGLCYYAFQIIKDKADAEEVAGDAFMKLWERHANFENAASIRSFLYTTTRNKSLNRIRQQKKDVQRSKALAYLTDGRENPVINQIIEAEVYREIFLALNTLPPKCREIFQMLFLEGKDYKQIAEELNLSIDTIRNQKARGLMLIRRRMPFGTMILFAIHQFN